MGMLNTVKDEMKQLIDILGISELRQAEIRHFQSENHAKSREKQRRNKVAFIVTKGIVRTLLVYKAINGQIILIRLVDNPLI